MKTVKSYWWIVIIVAGVSSCKVPAISGKTESRAVPSQFGAATDTNSAARTNWRAFFGDAYLADLIDTALVHNQELNITLQEIQIGRNEAFARRGEYLPFLQLRGAAGPDRAGKYTWDGFSEEDLKANPGKGPKYVGDFMAGTYFSWELDVWKKLHNAEKAATLRYLATTEGRNFLKTEIVAEIAESYYELLALDNLLSIIQQNISIQSSALAVVKLEKDAAKVSQLAVNRFEAQLLYTQNLQYEVLQKRTEAENRINFLAGRFPQPIQRSSAVFDSLLIDPVSSGLPSQLLENRPDIRRAELELAAAKLDVAVAKANFYPSFRLSAGLGFNAFNPVYLIRPESILFNLAGDLVAPLVNKNSIKATYSTANAAQIQAAYNFERSVLNAYVEVVNQMNRMENYRKSYVTKSREVDILNQSISISNKLFQSARADYIEVLLTQREALESRIELIEIKRTQLAAKVNIYRALGGGWN